MTSQNNNRPVILVHYHEIALKGRNRVWFENKLVENIRASLKPIGEFKIKKEWGRIVIADCRLPASTRGEQIADLIVNELSKIFGIAYFCLAQEIETNIDTIKQECLKVAQLKQFKTFRISTKRSWKQFEMTSEEINRAVAGIILKNQPNKKVDLKNFDLNIQIELSEEKTFIYTDKIQGPGGLPSGTSGQFLSLLSGGIDSPVASYLMMKRGALVDFIHFSSYPFIDKKSEDKVIQLAKQVAQYQTRANLYLIRFGDIQKQIVAQCDARYRILLYRSLMIKIAEKMALVNNYQALTTGESLGQVASQTIQNLTATSQGIQIPILRPLIGLDKQEIISLAKKINTYQLSIQPHQDCCSMFMPKNPVTKGNPQALAEQLNKLDLNSIFSNIKTNIKKVSLKLAAKPHEKQEKTIKKRLE